MVGGWVGRRGRRGREGRVCAECGGREGGSEVMCVGEGGRE